MSKIKNEYIVKENEIHIWDFNIEPSENLAALYFNDLSEVEKNKSNEIKIKDVKYRSIISKVIAKNILSKYLGININQITFAYNKFGKPTIFPNINHFNLNFNISHSFHMGIIALTKQNLIGIDIERIIALKDMDDIINLCFNDYEINRLSCLRNPSKMMIFYKIWTGKEAFVKAIGQGLTFPLKNIAFDFDNDMGINLKYIKNYPDSLTKWKIYNFSPQENYTSTLAVKNDSIQIKRFKWNHLNNIEN
jgi:4'-phosphopantetheinyl transferase